MPTMPDNAQAAAVVRAADAETLAGEPGAIALLLDSSDTDGALSTQRVSLRDGTDGAVPHHHMRSTELFFIVAGEAQLLAGETIITLGAGDAASIPARLVHAFAASPGHDADLLIVIAPGVQRFGYFRTLARMIGGELPPDALQGEQERYDTYFDNSAVWDARSRDRVAAPPPREGR